MKMNWWQKVILGFCIFLLAVPLFVSPLTARVNNPGSRFGVGAFVLNRYKDNEIDRSISAIKNLGATWSREEFIWSELSPRPGEWRWEIYDQRVRNLNKAGINILGLLDYSAPWATDDPDRENSDKYFPKESLWGEYVYQVVSHFDNLVSCWEIWNEPNSPIFFRPHPDAQRYFGLLSTAFKIIKKINPSAKVVLGGVSGVDAEYLDSLLRYGADDYCDIVAIHPYPRRFDIPPEIEGIFKDTEKINYIAERYSKRVWLTEFGWPTDNKIGVSEDAQAKFLLRASLIFLANKNIEKIFWYDLRDDGNDANNPEDNFGLIKKDYEEKLSYKVLKNMIAIVDGGELIDYENRDNIIKLHFRDSSYHIYVLWSFEENFTLKIPFAKNIKAYGPFGENVSGLATFGDFPIYIVSPSTLGDIDYQKNSKI